MKPSEELIIKLNRTLWFGKLKIKWAHISYRDNGDVKPIIKTYKLKRFYSKKSLKEFLKILDTKKYIFGIIKLNKRCWIDVFQIDNSYNNFHDNNSLHFYLRKKPSYFWFNPREEYDDIFDGKNDYKSLD